MHAMYLSERPMQRRRFLQMIGLATGASLLGMARRTGAQKVKEIQVWHTEVDPKTIKVMEEIIAQFEQAHPGVQVKQQAMGWGDLNTKLLAAIAAGNPPDLSHLNPFMTSSLYVNGLLHPMDELITHLGEDDIHPAVLKLQYFDGHYYGLTHAMGATYVARRQDLFEKKGLKDPETWDELLKVAEALTEGTPGGKRYGVTIPGEKLYMGFIHPAEWLASDGGQWVDPKTWRPKLDDQAMIDTLMFLQKLNTHMPPGWPGQKYLDTLAALSTDKVAMVWLSGARTIGYIERYAPENMRDPEHFAPMLKPKGPHGERGISALDGEDWAIFQMSKAPEETLEFLKVFYQRDNYLKYCHTVPIHLTPVLKSVLESPEYLDHPTIKKWRPWHDIVTRGLQENRYLPIGFTRPDDKLLPFLAELDGSGIVMDLISDVVVGGKEPKPAAEQAQTRAEELLTQLGYKRW